MLSSHAAAADVGGRLLAETAFFEATTRPATLSGQSECQRIAVEKDSREGEQYRSTEMIEHKCVNPGREGP
jgi:hypothetical protein